MKQGLGKVLDFFKRLFLGVGERRGAEEGAGVDNSCHRIFKFQIEPH